MLSRTPADLPAHLGARDAPLRATDRTFLVAIPLIVLCLAIGMPESAGAWTISGILGAVFVAVVWGAGRIRYFPRRGTVYTAVSLAISVGGLWLLGPLTGVGLAFGLTALFAGTFLSLRGVTIFTAIAAVAIGLWFVMHSRQSGWLEVGPAMWVALAIASGVILWIASRVLTALVSSLEDSYTRAADAYRDEMAAQAQLDTTRNQLEELAEVELVGRLAAGVAHDVNNALAGILAAADVMTEEVSSADQRRHLAELQAASYHAADLVRDLMWIGRKFPASSQAVAQLGPTVQACVERVGRIARAVTVEMSIEGAARVAVPPAHFEQMLFALIIGAHRAGASDLVLTSAGDAETVEITLRGVASARGAGDLVGDLDPSRGIRGRLGILAAKELVAQYGGTLRARVDAGEASVVVTVPRVSAAASATDEMRAQLTAVVVDDEPMILRRLCQLVTRRGYVVSSATTVADGLALLDQDPSLVVTDLQLPDGSGEAIAAASYARCAQRPIVICSGFGADDGLRDRLRPARIAFLQKPFSVEQLEDAIPLVSARRAAS